MNLIMNDEAEQNKQELKKVENLDQQHMMRRSLIENAKLCLCGRVFTPYRPYQKYCNDDCRVKYSTGKHSRYIKKDVETKTCQECGKPFDTNDGKRKYCKDKCYLKHELKRRKPKVERTCPTCGTTFKTSHWSKRYCKDECRKNK